MISKTFEAAKAVGNDWVAGPYYDDAEDEMEKQWTTVIWPIIGGSDFSSTLELAPGHGRNTAKLLPLASRIYAVDINQTNVDFLNRRFEGINNVISICNNGADFDGIDNASITFAYCFDAMVHFDSDVVHSYIKELRRIMRPGARAFVHYSAYDQNPTGSYRDHPGWRNFMNPALFHHWLSKEGFKILRSEYINGNSELTDQRGIGDNINDAVIYFELPGDAEASTAKSPTSFEDKIQDLRKQLRSAEATNQDLRVKLGNMHRSASWRWTAPMRWLRDAFGK
jgi:SAM-dependent methyltransferase